LLDLTPIEKFNVILNKKELNLVAILSGYLVFKHGASSLKEKLLEGDGGALLFKI
jgi:hypothetical protein